MIQTANPASTKQRKHAINRDMGNDLAKNERHLANWFTQKRTNTAPVSGPDKLLSNEMLCSTANRYLLGRSVLLTDHLRPCVWIQDACKPASIPNYGGRGTTAKNRTGTDWKTLNGSY